MQVSISNVLVLVIHVVCMDRNTADVGGLVEPRPTPRVETYCIFQDIGLAFLPLVLKYSYFQISRNLAVSRLPGSFQLVKGAEHSIELEMDQLQPCRTNLLTRESQQYTYSQF